MKKKHKINSNSAFQRSTITDIGIIICSISFVYSGQQTISRAIITGILLFFVYRVTFDPRPIKWAKERKSDILQLLSPRQKQTRAFLNKAIEHITKYFYIVLFFYAILFRIDKSLFWIILTCLYWIFFILYFTLRIICYKMRINY